MGWMTIAYEVNDNSLWMVVAYEMNDNRLWGEWQ